MEVGLYEKSKRCEVIQCRDCRYWKSDEERAKQTAWLPCMEMMTNRWWFCGSAKKKDDCNLSAETDDFCEGCTSSDNGMNCYLCKNR